jgi:uncharacterized membrane protein
MSLSDPESMNAIIGKVLRYGVLLSAVVIIIGTIGLAVSKGSSDVALQYATTIPHDGIDIGLPALLSGLASFSPPSWIELGVILLIATPVSRVLVSTFLFAAERDRLYVMITSIVLALLLFSMLVTPSIPGFNA